ncbi:MAG: class I SAM-dependent methyltransferase [Rubrobacter sp.]|nr:class I SAM-dependent methyltransferase [Rubrobacter sp.]
MQNHKENILDQFTKQAVPFSMAPAIRDEPALKLLLELTNATAADTVLDVACGPGIVVCVFATVVQHAAGIDLAPAMVQRAKTLQKEKGLANVTWEVGDVGSLPYADESFSIVTSRYAFHHLPEPRRVLSEMKRVCRPRGKVVLIDVLASVNAEKAALFNRMERLRDPSHVCALTLAEQRNLFQEVGLGNPQAAFYKLDMELESMLQRSFPNEGNADKVRQMVLDSMGDDEMGIDTRREDSVVRFSYPISILIAEEQAY